MAIPRRSTLRGRWMAATRKVREYAMVVRALADTSHPVLAQIIPTRFCNLSCAYCNEYDKVSEPVPLEEMYRRIDHLGRLGTAMIGISGGEPLTHPRPGRHHPAHEEDGRDCGHDHQRLSAQPGANRAAEPRGPRPHADLDRQPGAGRGVEEEPEDSGQAAWRCWPSMPSST